MKIEIVNTLKINNCFYEVDDNIYFFTKDGRHYDGVIKSFNDTEIVFYECNENSDIRTIKFEDIDIETFGK